MIITRRCSNTGVNNISFKEDRPAFGKSPNTFMYSKYLSYYYYIILQHAPHFPLPVPNDGTDVSGHQQKKQLSKVFPIYLGNAEHSSAARATSHAKLHSAEQNGIEINCK